MSGREAAEQPCRRQSHFQIVCLSAVQPQNKCNIEEVLNSGMKAELGERVEEGHEYRPPSSAAGSPCRPAIIRCCHFPNSPARLQDEEFKIVIS